MNTEQIAQALGQKFFQEGHRLVFWHDPEGEFADEVRSRFGGQDSDSVKPLSEVKLLDLSRVGGFSAKLLLEREDPVGKYLIYSTGSKAAGQEKNPLAPLEEIDWLLDICLYSAEFHADMTSLWLQELGLTRLDLTRHLRQREKFMASAERRGKLAELVSPGDDEAALDLKMMTVLVKSKIPNLFEILQGLCHSHLNKDERTFDLEQPCELVETFEKMGLAEPFWDLVRQKFSSPEEPQTLAGLLRRIFVSELFLQASGARFPSLTHLRLPLQGSRNALVFLTQWRDSSSRRESYDAVARAVEAEQNIAASLQEADLEQIRQVFTFSAAEKAVVARLRTRVLEQEQTIDASLVAEVVVQRKSGHWLGVGSGRDQTGRVALANAYEAILAAAQMFEVYRCEHHRFEFSSIHQVVEAYCQRLYRFDQLYRGFCNSSRLAMSMGWDLLKALSERIERLYDQGFLQPLARQWDQLLEAGFVDHWHLPGIVSQPDFFNRVIKPHLAADDRKRAFVIISDAFRYEAAEELTRELKGKQGLVAELSPMLGVLPSYTKLGMASLLPRQTLRMDERGEVLIDERPLASTEARNQHLARYQGMAVQAEAFLKFTSEEVREATREARIVYIYHNVIDARGDSASTEEQTFEAVSDCLVDLQSLVSVCVNKLNASKVWITADHGFLFQRQAPDGTDRSHLAQKPSGTVLAKKRYLIGSGLGNFADVHHGRVAQTSSASGEMEFWVPKGTNRFHFTGGARYLHGGAMPQEVLVPVVVVSQVRGKKAITTRVDKVSVQVLGHRHRITTPAYRFELIQAEPVSERRKPITLRVAIYLDGKPVTSVETVTFDSTSEVLEQRKKPVRLELANEAFDKSKSYVLILRDQDNDREVQSIPVVIDRSFDDDF